MKEKVHSFKTLSKEPHPFLHIHKGSFFASALRTRQTARYGSIRPHNSSHKTYLQSCHKNRNIINRYTTVPTTENFSFLSSALILAISTSACVVGVFCLGNFAESSLFRTFFLLKFFKETIPAITTITPVNSPPMETLHKDQ